MPYPILNESSDPFSTVEFQFGDQRINRRANFMFDTMVKCSERSLPRIFSNGSDLKGAYRFFSNDLVTPEKILKPHSIETALRCKQQSLVAVIQDSSDLDFDYMECLEGFRSLHINVKKGFRIHPLLAITEQGTPLGVLDAFNYTRDEAAPNKKHRNSLLIEQKESYRWLLGYRRTCELAAQAKDAIVVSIADREGDIYECLSEAQNPEISHKAHILVRAQHNRSLAKTSDEATNKLEKKLIRCSVNYEGKLHLNRYREKERVANVAIRTCRVTIEAPNTCRKKFFPEIEMNAVLVSEIDPPKSEQEVYWLLLTTLPIDTNEEIARVVSLYSRRWSIEIFFKVLKSGCKIDSCHLQTTNRIENYIALSMVVAWRVMLATYLPREYPDAPCNLIFTEIEWKLAHGAAYRTRPLPEKPPTLKEAAMLIAMLGGYQKRKDPPGIQTVWRGIVRVMDMVYGQELSQKLFARGT